jgi:Na+/H+ antiporter NhaD/arsenite permease-like protein
LSFAIPQQLDLSVYVSLAFLFGIAAQFRAMDGYSFLRRIIAIFERKIGILYAVVIVTALFSPFILNDVVIIVLTPVIIRYAKKFNVDIAPLVVAEIAFTNIASSLTPLGNPQNILLWNTSKVSFYQFVLGTSLPLIISGTLAVLFLLPFRKRVGGAREFPTSTEGSRLPALYLVIVILAIALSDLFGLPPYISLGISFLFGFFFTFRSLKQFIREFDLRSLLILYLFVGSVTLVSIVVGSAVSGYALPIAQGVQPYSALFIGILSNVISNVPATQLILSITTISPHIAPQIAVEAGLAGNIDPIASFANILALLMVRRAGFSLRKIIILQFLIGLVSFLPALI